MDLIANNDVALSNTVHVHATHGAHLTVHLVLDPCIRMNYIVQLHIVLIQGKQKLQENGMWMVLEWLS